MNEIVTIADAKARGLRWYFTGKPCPRGHVSKRNVSNRECRGCVDAKKSAKYHDDIEAGRAKDRERYHRNGDKNRAQMRASRERHIEKRRAEDRARYYANADHKKRAQLAITNARRRRHRQATPPWLTAEQKRVMRLMYKIAKDLPGDWHVDHIEPLTHPDVCGLHVPWNLQIIPAVENLQKRNRRVTA